MLVSTWNRTIKRNNHSRMTSFRSYYQSADYNSRSVSICTSVTLDSRQTYISANERQVPP